MSLVSFTEEQKAGLLKLLREREGEGNHRPNTSEGFYGEGDNWQTTDTHVAKTPSGGISAISGTSPGSEKCNIYRITIEGDLIDIGLEVEVYNTSGEDIDGDTYPVVGRLKHGEWVVMSASASAGLTPFEIESVADDCNSVTAIIYDPQDCNTEENTGTGTEEQITVYDLLDCEFNRVAKNDLPGTRGWATRRNIVVNAITGTGTSTAGECTNEYVVVRLCCPELD